MAGPIGTQARLTLKSSLGNKRLRRVDNYKISFGGGREGVNAVGEDDPVGTTKKPGGWTITLEVYFEQSNPEIDYDKLYELDEWFTFEMALVGGKSFQYPEVQVAKPPEPSGDKDGKHMFTVELFARRRKKL